MKTHTKVGGEEIKRKKKKRERSNMSLNSDGCFTRPQIRVIRAFQSGVVEPLDAEDEVGRSRGLGTRTVKHRPHSVSDNASLDLLVDPEGSTLPEVEGSR